MSIITLCLFVWLVFSLLVVLLSTWLQYSDFPLHHCCIFYKTMSVMSFIFPLIREVSFRLLCDCVSNAWWTVMCSKAVGASETWRSPAQWSLLNTGSLFTQCTTVWQLTFTLKVAWCTASTTSYVHLFHNSCFRAATLANGRNNHL